MMSKAPPVQEALLAPLDQEDAASAYSDGLRLAEDLGELDDELLAQQDAPKSKSRQGAKKKDKAGNP